MIGIFYKSTLNGAKPKFLSLQESNQQILVVNTSCVDGSIVFIDPISFSMLKKIQLRYQDHEVPKHVTESIQHIQQVFDQTKEKTGKSAKDIFHQIDKEAGGRGEIPIKMFVQKLSDLDPCLSQERLYHACHQLDENSSGTISISEFISYFG